MADWTGQLIMARRQVTEIEKKIVQQQQIIEQRHREGADTSQSARLITVLQQSSERAKSHVAFIEYRIAVEESNRKASAALIDSLREGLKPKAETLCGSVARKPGPKGHATI
jgi:hypothetical protein